QDRQKERAKSAIAASSVKVLRICTQINEELTQTQKIIVLFQLFEFVKSGSDIISDQELEFIRTVAEIFYVSKEEHNLLKRFVIDSVDELPDSEHLLLINNHDRQEGRKTRFLKRELLEGVILILEIRSANIYLLRYLGRGELYLNSQILLPDKVNVLQSGSTIRNHVLKPIYFSDIISCYIEDKIESKITFNVTGIEYKFKNGNVGLHPMSFTEESGRLVGIMGASGAGKSTLLNVLNGSSNPDNGTIKINGIDIHKESYKLKGLIGYVSQDDLLIEELTVFQNLYYNAKLCFDKHSENEITEIVHKTLQNLGLLEIKDTQVGSPLNKKISGGQRKRLNIALELIREPAVLFLDEPTSGLSSRDSENIMDLLKELALKGKLVFVVIHQPSSHIFKMFDRLLILDTGGYLIYSGDPIESIVYFKEQTHQANWSESECHVCGNVNPEQIFNIVEANVLNEYGQQTHTRKISPAEWAQHFREFAARRIKPIKLPNELPRILFNVPSKLNQFKIFVKRDILAKLSNSQYLVINILEAPILALILSFLIRYFDESTGNNIGYTLEGNMNIPVYIFMSVIVAIFMGLSISAEEIIKDRKILKRESFLNLSWFSYLLSKVAILFLLSAIQAALFVFIGNTIIGIKGMYFHYWLMLFSAWASSNIMGLVISDSFKTVVTIYILIPFLVIPQIILSGVIVKYENLNPNISSPDRIPLYGEIITARWAYEGLAVHQFTHNPYERIFYTYDKAMSRSEFRKVYWIPNLQNKVDFVQRNLHNPAEKDLVETYLKLLHNEISLENQLNDNVRFAYCHLLREDKINHAVLDELQDYLKISREYYIKLYNRANKMKDKEVAARQQTEEGRQAFLKLKRENYNEKLAEFVENKNEITKIIEFRDRLYQKTDPIFLDPQHNLIKAHFYAPNKKIFGQMIPTFWANLLVIWFISILFFTILYFRLLKRFLLLVESVSIRIKK
ncbi:MAG: ATP-binding cassette domain-containing protein, partial [Bacteroidota bacterium]